MPIFGSSQKPGNKLSMRGFIAFSLLLSFSLAVPASWSAPYPGTGAPIAALRQMTSDGTDPSNPFSYPFLANITRSLAKNGIPPGFFVGTEGKPVGGIDLRTLLLFEAGVLKSPVKLFMPRKRDENLPSLAMPAIPESSGEMPSLDLPRRISNPSESNQGSDDAPQVVTKPGLGPTVLDLSRIKLGVAGSSSANQGTSLESPILAHTTLGMGTTSPLPSKFRFWTVYPGNKVAAKKTPPPASTDFDGSFVLSSPGGVKSIEGRSFNLKSGRILASTKDKEITVDTPLAKVAIAPGATALVEILKPGLTLVRALEGGSGQSEISVRINGKTEPEKLAVGEDLLLGDHTISSADKTLAGISSSDSSSENWLKGKFNMNTVLDKEPFLRVDSPDQSIELRSAVDSLRKRLK